MINIEHVRIKNFNIIKELDVETNSHIVLVQTPHNRVFGNPTVINAICWCLGEYYMDPMFDNNETFVELKINKKGKELFIKRRFSTEDSVETYLIDDKEVYSPINNNISNYNFYDGNSLAINNIQREIEKINISILNEILDTYIKPYFKNSYNYLELNFDNNKQLRLYNKNGVLLGGGYLGEGNKVLLDLYTFLVYNLCKNDNVPLFIDDAISRLDDNVITVVLSTFKAIKNQCFIVDDGKFEEYLSQNEYCKIELTKNRDG